MKKTIFVVVLLVFLASVVSAETDWSVGLIEKLDYTSNINGSLHKCNTSQALSVGTEGIFLDGSTRLDYGCNLTNISTIVVWVKTTLGVGGIVQEQYSSTETEGEFSLGLNKGNVSFTRYISSGNPDFGYGIYTLNDSRWKQIVVRDGSTIMEGYQNTSSLWSSTFQNKHGRMGSATNHLRVGQSCSNDACNEYFTGNIKKVLFYDYSLTDNQIEEQYLELYPDYQHSSDVHVDDATNSLLGSLLTLGGFLGLVLVAGVGGFVIVAVRGRRDTEELWGFLMKLSLIIVTVAVIVAILAYIRGST